MTLEQRAVWMVAVLVAGRDSCFDNPEVETWDINFFEKWERQLFYDHNSSGSEARNSKT